MVKSNNEIILILKLLIERKEERLSIRKISILRDINYKTAYVCLHELEKLKLVKLSRIGNTIECKVESNFNQMVYLTEKLRQEELSKDFQVIKNRFEELNFPLVVLLFGSHAKKTANKHSDIDLLIVTDNEKEANKVVSLLPDKIHSTFLTFNEFIKIAKTGRFSVVSEAIKNNIILLGIEEYYRMLKNARR